MKLWPLIVVGIAATLLLTSGWASISVSDAKKRIDECAKRLSSDEFDVFVMQ